MSRKEKFWLGISLLALGSLQLWIYTKNEFMITFCAVWLALVVFIFIKTKP